MRERILAVVGARPNYVKMAPVLEALVEGEHSIRLLHTGQHYDSELSAGFIERLGMRAPDLNLGVGSGSHGQQTAGVMSGVEREHRERPAELALVAGDVNSTMAAALAAAKCQIPVAHVESGLRSHDFSMPEEVNRVVTDRVSDLLLCHCQEAVENLAAEGIRGEGVKLVGNTMIDSLLRVLESVDSAAVLAGHGLEPTRFCLVTLHRPALVDDPGKLAGVLGALERIGREILVIVPLHPRTRARMEAAGLTPGASLRVIEPLEYPDFVALQSQARLVVTDSGGVQEETSVLGVRCLTYRNSTERPITVTDGTNRLVGRDPEALAGAVREELSVEPSQGGPAIPLWDGRAGPRAAAAIAGFLKTRLGSARARTGPPATLPTP